MLQEIREKQIAIATTVFKFYENKSFCQKTLQKMEAEADLDKKLEIAIKTLEHYENRAKCKVALNQIKDLEESLK